MWSVLSRIFMHTLSMLQKILLGVLQSSCIIHGSGSMIFFSSFFFKASHHWSGKENKRRGLPSSWDTWSYGAGMTHIVYVNCAWHVLLVAAINHKRLMLLDVDYSFVFTLNQSIQQSSSSWTNLSANHWKDLWSVNTILSPVLMASAIGWKWNPRHMET